MIYEPSPIAAKFNYTNKDKFDSGIVTRNEVKHYMAKYFGELDPDFIDFITKYGDHEEYCERDVWNFLGY